ncbi:hypothetical protein K456DRAFT_58846 [Colletotrichum gloeosporioides 23]|nr:hypothetical protein K456DRAFT_58846 [Colletotrichum gloeosporioides 23]
MPSWHFQNLPNFLPCCKVRLSRDFAVLRDLLPFSLCPNPILPSTRGTPSLLILALCSSLPDLHRSPFAVPTPTPPFPSPPLSPKTKIPNEAITANDRRYPARTTKTQPPASAAQRARHSGRPTLRKHRKHSEQEKQQQQQGDDPTISPTQPIIRRPMAFSCTGIVIKRDISKGLAKTDRPEVFCCVIPAAALYLLYRAFPSCLQVTLRALVCSLYGRVRGPVLLQLLRPVVHPVPDPAPSTALLDLRPSGNGRPTNDPITEHPHISSTGSSGTACPRRILFHWNIRGIIQRPLRFFPSLCLLVSKPCSRAATVLSPLPKENTRNTRKDPSGNLLVLPSAHMAS